MRLALVLNPAKGAWAQVLHEATSLASAAGWPDPQLHLTTREETGAAQARAALADGAHHVVVGGGDGTVREVAHALAHSGATLGIVPIGTANLLAHNLGLPRSVPAAARIAVEGRARPLDLGLARVDDEARDLPFVVLAGMGHDAATVAATQPALKERIGWPAYLAPAAVSALRRPVPVTVRHDGGEPQHLRVWSVLAANCTRVRGGVHIAPGGLVDDGLLDVLEVTVRHPAHWFSVAAKGVLRLPGDVPGLSTRASREVEVVSETPLHVQLDGDVVRSATRLHARVEQHALSVRTGG